MTDVEKFEYKSKTKPIKYGSNNLSGTMKKGLKCVWRCVKMNSTANNKIFMFSWKFNWDELKKRGIDRLSGYIILQLYTKPIVYKIMEDVKIDIDLRKPNQIIKKVIKTSVPSYNNLAMFEYSLIPHYTPIEEVKKEYSSSVQNESVPNNNANEKQVNSDEMASTTERYHDLERQNEDLRSKRRQPEKSTVQKLTEKNDALCTRQKEFNMLRSHLDSSESDVKEWRPKANQYQADAELSKKPVDTTTQVNEKVLSESQSDGIFLSSEQNDAIRVVEGKKIHVNKVIASPLSDEIFSLSDKNNAILVVDGKKIHVNKVFLSYHSEFFRNLFSLNYKMNEIPFEGVSYDDFKLLLETISPNTVFPTDETVEKLLELANRFMMPSVIRHVEHHLLYMSKLGNGKKMWMGEKFGMSDLLEKSILEIDTMEKAKKWKQSPEYSNFSHETKNRVLERFF